MDFIKHYRAKFVDRFQRMQSLIGEFPSIYLNFDQEANDDQSTEGAKYAVIGKTWQVHIPEINANEIDVAEMSRRFEDVIA